MTRSCAERADSSVVLTATQSDTTGPSNPHVVFSGSRSSGCSLMAVPLTPL